MCFKTPTKVCPMVKKIYNSNLTQVHKAWRTAQNKCGLKYGDVDPMTVNLFNRKIEKKGMTPKEIQSFALKYYRKMGMCKKKRK
jgi:hypothetical protein